MDYCININLIHLDIPALILADKTCHRRSANLALVTRGYQFSTVFEQNIRHHETHYNRFQRLTENTRHVPIQRQCHYFYTSVYFPWPISSKSRSPNLRSLLFFLRHDNRRKMSLSNSLTKLIFMRLNGVQHRNIPEER